MNNALRRISFFVGVGLLALSMYWSQDGFNFNVAGQSGYETTALIIGWFLAISVTCIEFVFSSNYKELNASLIFFGILAYAYSIYTNYQGILHFQGDAQSKIGAFVLGVVIDGVPEPLIAWSLYESLSGDFVGNLIKTFASSPDRLQKPKEVRFQQEEEHKKVQEEKPKTFDNFQKNYESGQNNGHTKRINTQFHYSGKHGKHQTLR